ncbi:MAG: hypothetical protein D6785_05115 [Planctomycetota bacterium]|nr:MAG: hypothetical protein D6785_05115 [Planctomycetota bacterium]
MLDSKHNNLPSSQMSPSEKSTKWGLLGAVVAAFTTSLCCIGPLILMALGTTGAWMSNLTVLEPYRPFFMIIAFSFLGYAFFRVYGKKSSSFCCENGVCIASKTEKYQKVALWLVTLLVVSLMGIPYLLPYFSSKQSKPKKQAHLKENNSQVPPARKEKILLQIENMTCEGCSMHIQKRLLQIPGVLEAKISLEPPQGMVLVDSKRVNPEKILQAAKEIGYPSKIVRIQKEDKTHQVVSKESKK